MQSTMSPSDTSMDIGDVEQAIMSHQKQKQTIPEEDEEEVEVLLSPSSSSSPPLPSTTTTTTTAASTSTSSVIPSSSSSATATSSNTIEHKIGGVIYEEFKCQHNNFTGLLKVGPLGILFLGKFLLFEWTVIIKWENVQKVKRKLIGSQKWTAIRIDTSGGSNGNPNPHVYDFEGFFDSHKVLEVLITLHNDSMLTGAIINNPHNPRMSINQSLLSITGGTGNNGNAGDLKSSRPLLRRTNSNPSQQISTLFNFDDIPLAATAAAATTTTTEENNVYNEYNRKAMEDLQKQYYCNTNTNETIAAATAASISASTSGSTTTTATTTAAAVTTTRTNKIKGGRDDTDTASVMSAATAPAGMSYNVVGDNSKKGNDNNSVSSSNSSVCSSPPRRHFMRRDTSMSIATINESGGDDDTGGDTSGGNNESVVIVDNDNIMVQNEYNKEQQKDDDDVVVSFNKEQQQQQQQQIRSEWNKAYDEFIQNYTGKGEIAIKDRELQLAFSNNGNGSDDDMLELFVNNFINDDADHSMSSFMIDIVHDRDLKVSKWVIETNEIETEDNNGDASGAGSSGAVNAPMPPPQAKAEKEQILKKYHNCGIIIETKTFVSDVPMTDCFYVTDTICISLPTSSSDDDDETNQKRCKLILNIRFDIVFVKSTYFRSLIYHTTKNEMQQFMMNFTEYIIAKLAVLPSTKKATTNETDDSTSTAAIISPITTKAIISSSSSSSNQPARGVASSSKIATTITTNDDNNNSNNWNWWWKILSFLLLILIAKLQIQVLNEIKSVRIEIQQQQREQQQQVPEQCKLNNLE
ncbi:hypothetical protein FRACYDRAFT_252660 [Fragilariopsis cylindrus CCMP1102]|uniref:VASt domain-containing protein n=1 Tax=Fragilariopsis cylindrus CCMP1102 TaxID=635003 RepID=A0A1E7ELT6_9STRA|nr:hypothetical protein FRACYDRAFT_252660 [Fragilariopsis cylindrus CCMP1102]|eukprot:OEU06845.1 hypothetical protein FRACYDRAFT_252660 [Fragilariopsis cylindrus CCMP1102]